MREVFLLALLWVVVALPAGARLYDQEPSNNYIGTTLIQIAVPPDANVVMSDTGLLVLTAGGGDTDYLGISGLQLGDIVELATTPLGDPPFFEIPDTIAGLFSSDGTQDCVGDDAYNNDLDKFPTGFGSLCRFQIVADGTYYIGVTGFSEIPFDGSHFEEGAYSLTVSVTRLPEPAVMAQVAAGALGLLALARRRRAGA